MNQPDRCYQIIRPGDVNPFQRPELRADLKTHARALQEASRRLVVNGGLVTDSIDPDTAIPLLAHQLLDRQTGIYKGETELHPSISNGDLAGVMGGWDRVRFDLKPNRMAAWVTIKSWWLI